MPEVWHNTDRLRDTGIDYILEKTGQAFFGWNSFYRDDKFLTFVAVHDQEFSPLFTKSYSKGCPLDVKVNVLGVGRSSCTIGTEIYKHGSDECLIADRIKFVLIDHSSRKPVNIPQWFLDKCNENNILIGKYNFHIPPFNKPQTTFVHHIKVMFVDTDNNLHTTFSAYGRYALNALHYAVYLKNLNLNDQCNINESSLPLSSLSGTKSWNGNLSALEGLTDELIKRGLKTVKTVYLSECKEGEDIFIHCWLPHSVPDKNIICISIEKNTGERICQLQFEFFPFKMLSPL